MDAATPSVPRGAHAALVEGCESGLWPGAVLLVRRPGEADRVAAVGVRDVQRRDPLTPDTVFDLASITKVFTSLTCLGLATELGWELDRPIGDVLAAWRGGARASVSLRHLLTHTSGLPPTRRLHDLPARERHAALLTTPLEAAPGTRFAYSCVGLQTAGMWAERLSGRPLPELVDRLVTGPLGLAHTGFTPRTRGERRPIAPTEVMTDPPRGLVHGEVHDEASWALGGTAGNAGVFAPAAELAALGAYLLADGPLARAMREPQLSAELAAQAGFQHGLGVRIGQRTLTGPSPRAFGHGGFTGTALAVSPDHGTVAVLLTHRVHPSRDAGDIAPLRQRVVDAALAG